MNVCTQNAVVTNLGMLLIRSSISKILLEESLSNRLDEFQACPTRMNDRIAEIDHLDIKRFFNLDSGFRRTPVSSLALAQRISYNPHEIHPAS